MIKRENKAKLTPLAGEYHDGSIKSDPIDLESGGEYARGTTMTRIRFCFLSAVLAAQLVIGSNKATADAGGPPDNDIECVPIIFDSPKNEKIKRFVWGNSLAKYDDHPPRIQDWNATYVAIVDLNGDGKDDVIVTRKDYCGAGGCSLTAIVRTGEKSGYEVDIVPGVHLSAPICVEPKKTDGLFNIVINKDKRLKFRRHNKSYE